MKGFDDFVEETRKEAIRIMKIEMPRKLIELDKLANVRRGVVDSWAEYYGEHASVSRERGRRCVCRSLERSEEMEGMVTLGDPEDGGTNQEGVVGASGLCYNRSVGGGSSRTCRFYIKLNQPRKEDGNTFGVEVQNEIISDLNDALDGARQLLSDMISYFSMRASVVATVGEVWVVDR